MGIGGGWYEHEWRVHGYGFPSDGTRLAMLEEKDVQDKLEWITAHYQPLIPAHELERHQRMYRTGSLVGTPEPLVGRFREAEQMGMTYAIGNFADAAYDPASMDLFANVVAADFA